MTYFEMQRKDEITKLTSTLVIKDKDGELFITISGNSGSVELIDLPEPQRREFINKIKELSND